MTKATTWIKPAASSLKRLAHSAPNFSIKTGRNHRGKGGSTSSTRRIRSAERFAECNFSRPRPHPACISPDHFQPRIVQRRRQHPFTPAAGIRTTMPKSPAAAGLPLSAKSSPLIRPISARPTLKISDSSGMLAAASDSRVVDEGCKRAAQYGYGRPRPVENKDCRQVRDSDETGRVRKFPIFLRPRV